MKENLNTPIPKEKQKIIDDLIEQWSLHNVELKKIEAQLAAQMTETVIDKSDSELKDEQHLNEVTISQLDTNSLVTKLEKEKMEMSKLQSEINKWTQEPKK